MLGRVALESLDAVAGDQGGFSARQLAREILTGELDSGADLIDRVLGEVSRAVRSELAGLFVRLAIPMTAAAGLRLLLGGHGGAARPAGLLCALCCALALAEYCSGAREIAAGLMDRLSGATGTLAPILASAMALTGTVDGASFVTPMAAECSDLIARVCAAWGLPLCAAAAAVAVAGNLSERFTLDRLFQLEKCMLRWLLGLAMFAFTALLSVRGVMSAARDSLSVRAARTAIEGMVPVIGGELSDAAGALAVSASLVRSAVGMTGVAAVLHACMRPLIRLGAMTLTLKIDAAVLEPLADGRLARIAGRLGEVMEMMIALCAASAAMVMLLIGGAILQARMLML